MYNKLMEALTVQAYLLPSSQKFRNMQNLLLVPRTNVNDKTHLLVPQLYKLQERFPVISIEQHVSMKKEASKPKKCRLSSVKLLSEHWYMLVLHGILMMSLKIICQKESQRSALKQL